MLGLKNKRLFPLIIFLGTLFGLSRADAQWKYLKNHPDVHQVFVPIIETARKATVQIEKNRKQVALGAIIDPAGLIVSKSSELDVSPMCMLHGSSGGFCITISK